MPTKDRDDQLLILVGNLDGKVDLLLQASETQGTRIRDLERWQSRIVGIALGVGGAAGGIVAKVAAFLPGGILAH